MENLAFNADYYCDSDLASCEIPKWAANSLVFIDGDLAGTPAGSYTGILAITGTLIIQRQHRLGRRHPRNRRGTDRQVGRWWWEPVRWRHRRQRRSDSRRSQRRQERLVHDSSGRFRAGRLRFEWRRQLDRPMVHGQPRPRELDQEVPCRRIPPALGANGPLGCLSFPARAT